MHRRCTNSWCTPAIARIPSGQPKVAAGGGAAGAPRICARTASISIAPSSLAVAGHDEAAVEALAGLDRHALVALVPARIAEARGEIPERLLESIVLGVRERPAVSGAGEHGGLGLRAQEEHAGADRAAAPASRRQGVGAELEVVG